MDDKIIIVTADGVNGIEIGNHRLCVVKNGGSQILKVKPNEKFQTHWVWIPVEFLEAAKSIGDSKFTYDKWGNWEDKTAKPVHKFGIGRQSVVSNGVQIKTEKKYFLNGTILYVEPFFDYPKFEKGFFIATVEKPQILSAYFANYKDEFLYPDEQGKSNTHTYKSSIKLFVTTHRIPDYTVPYHNFALFEVDIYEDCQNKVTDEPLRFYQRTNTGKFSVNTLTELNIYINEDWREKTGHKEGVKVYSAKIKTTIYSNEDAYTGEKGQEGVDKTKWLSGNPNRNSRWATNKFAATAPNHEIIGVEFTSEDEIIHWFGGRQVEQGKNKAAAYKKENLDEIYDTTGEQVVVLKDQEVSFTVRYDDMDVVLDRYEAKKNDMMVVVGDIEYTQKNNDPCKYSKILIEHKSRDKPFVLFDENEKTKEKPTDKTDMAFGLTAGNEKETVTITAEGLAIQEYQAEGLKKPRCHGITTYIDRRRKKTKVKKEKNHYDESFKHKTIKDVFNMETAYMLYPENRMVTTSPFSGVMGDEKIDITGQNLEYSYLENGIKLEVAYLYNKTYDTRAQDLLGDEVGEWTNDLLDIAWIARYIFDVKDRAQTYMVPIATCRYPNQTAIIEVYPNFEWWVNIKYNAENYIYVYQTPSYKDRFFTTGKSQNKKKKAAYLTERKKRMDGSYKLDVEAGFKYNGASYSWSVGNGFSVLKVLNFILHAYEIIQDIFYTKHTSSSKAEAIGEGQAVRNSNGKLDMDGHIPPSREQMINRAKIRKMQQLPVRFTLSRPSISLGAYFKYEKGKTNPGIMDYFGEIKVDAEPLTTLEGRLDLLYFAQFLGPVGTIVSKVNTVFDGINFLTCGAVEIDYQLDLFGTVDANISISGNYHGKEGFDGDFLVALPVSVGIECGGTLKYDFGKVEGMAAASGIASADFEITVTPNHREQKYPGELYFKGLKCVFTLKMMKKEDDSGSAKKPESKWEDSGDGNESITKEVEILEPWPDPITFDFF